MKRNTSLNPIGMTEGEKKSITVDPVLGGDQPIVRITRTDNGEEIRFTDYYGKSISVKLPSLTPGKKEQEGVVRKMTALSLSNTCPCCGCVYDHFCGMTVLIDPTTGGLCPHH